jgi:uncharacterized damage-inducible protein DinB
MTDLSYPIGRFDWQAPADEAARRELIESLARLPASLRAAVAGLSDEQLTTPYRPGGWTPRQVVHHVADSHLNGYTRLKLALTEDEPTIKPYAEGAWAELEDTHIVPLEVSLALLEALHTRWAGLWRSLTPRDFGRTLNHPEMGVMSVATMLGLYEWHGRHHTAHVAGLRERMGW